MRIYPPSPDREFQPVVGGLTEEDFSQLEARLNAEVPAAPRVKWSGISPRLTCSLPENA